MNSIPPFAVKAASLLRDAMPSQVPPPKHALVRAVAQAIRQRKQTQLRHQRIIVAICTFSALAASTIGAFVWHNHGVNSPQPEARATAASVTGSVFVESGGKTTTLRDGARFEQGAHLIALTDAKASLTWPSGTRIALEGATDLSLLSQDHTKLFQLGSGSIRADVAKLREGERFLIRTSDAEVEVHGTSFRVSKVTSEPTCGDATTTRVIVFEGVVTVRAHGAESRVAAGDFWPHGCVSAPPASGGMWVGPSPSNESHASEPHTSEPHSIVAPVLVPDAKTAKVALHSTAAPKSSGGVLADNGQSVAPSSAAEAQAPRRSELAKQNDLFDEATAARRRGDSATALQRFNEFLARYPNSALTETVAAERMRTLSASGSPDAQSAAHEYIKRYPSGFARTDADRVMSGQH